MRSLVKTSAVLMAVMLVYKLFGFVEKIFLAQQFGTGPAADAYLAGSSAVLLVGLLLNDIAGPALIPILLARKDRAEITLAAVLTWTLLVMLPVAWVISHYAVWWASLFGPGFDEYTLGLTAEIIQITSWSIPLLCLASIVTAWFHARQVFVQPALADLMLKVGPLAGLAFIGGLAGLTYGLLAGAVFRLLLLFNLNLPRRPRFGRDSQLSVIVVAAWPLLLNTLVSVHLLSLVETAIASTISSGAVAAFAYARRVVDTPVIIFPLVISRVVFPTLTEHVLAGRYTQLKLLLQRCIRLTFLITLPLMIIGMVFASPLIQLLLQRGAFDQQSRVATAQVMLTILPGLPALALSLLLVRFNYATGDTFWPSAIRFLGAGVQIGLALWLRRWGLMGLGLATTISLWLETVVLVGVAFRSIGFRPTFEARFWGMLGLGSGVMLGICMLWKMVLFTPQTASELLLYLVFVSLIACVSYAVVLLLGRVAEIHYMLRAVQNWRKSA